jgi:hypothetical protein
MRRRVGDDLCWSFAWIDALGLMSHSPDGAGRPEWGGRKMSYGDDDDGDGYGDDCQWRWRCCCRCCYYCCCGCWWWCWWWCRQHQTRNGGGDGGAKLRWNAGVMGRRRRLGGIVWTATVRAGQTGASETRTTSGVDDGGDGGGGREEDVVAMDLIDGGVGVLSWLELPFLPMPEVTDH